MGVFHVTLDSPVDELLACADEHIGSLLKLHEIVGKGGFATVYKATFDRYLCACKVLQPRGGNLPPDPIVRLFVRECITLMAMEHRCASRVNATFDPLHIQGRWDTARLAQVWGKELLLSALPARAKVLSAVIRCTGLLRLRKEQVPHLSYDTYGMLLEFCEGGTLKDLLLAQLMHSRDQYTIREALGWLAQVASALHQFHCLDLPIIHRDIKPDNVLLQLGTSMQLELRAPDPGAQLPPAHSHLSHNGNDSLSRPPLHAKLADLGLGVRVGADRRVLVRCRAAPLTHGSVGAADTGSGGGLGECDGGIELLLGAAAEGGEELAGLPFMGFTTTPLQPALSRLPSRDHKSSPRGGGGSGGGTLEPCPTSPSLTSLHKANLLNNIRMRLSGRQWQETGSPGGLGGPVVRYSSGSGTGAEERSPPGSPPPLLLPPPPPPPLRPHVGGPGTGGGPGSSCPARAACGCQVAGSCAQCGPSPFRDFSLLHDDSTTEEDGGGDVLSPPLGLYKSAGATGHRPMGRPVTSTSAPLPGGLQGNRGAAASEGARHGTAVQGSGCMADTFTPYNGTPVAVSDQFALPQMLPAISERSLSADDTSLHMSSAERGSCGTEGGVGAGTTVSRGPGGRAVGCAVPMLSGSRVPPTAPLPATTSAPEPSRMQSAANCTGGLSDGPSRPVNRIRVPATGPLEASPLSPAGSVLLPPAPAPPTAVPLGQVEVSQIEVDISLKAPTAPYGSADKPTDGSAGGGHVRGGQAGRCGPFSALPPTASAPQPVTRTQTHTTYMSAGGIPECRKPLLPPSAPSSPPPLNISLSSPPVPATAVPAGLGSASLPLPLPPADLTLTAGATVRSRGGGAVTVLSPRQLLAGLRGSRGSRHMVGGALTPTGSLPRAEAVGLSFLSTRLSRDRPSAPLSALVAPALRQLTHVESLGRAMRRVSSLLRTLNWSALPRFRPNSDHQWVFALTGQAGSCMYMAPEVFRGEPYNEKVDVFSFGVMMYELLARELLVVKYLGGRGGAVVGVKDPKEYAGKVCEGFRPPRHPRIPESLWLLIQACWHPDPLARPDMGEVVARLQVAAGEWDWLHTCGPLSPSAATSTSAHASIRLEPRTAADRAAVGKAPPGGGDRRGRGSGKQLPDLEGAVCEGHLRGCCVVC